MINILTLNSMRCSMRYWARNIYSNKVFLQLPLHAPFWSLTMEVMWRCLIIIMRRRSF